MNIGKYYVSAIRINKLYATPFVPKYKSLWIKKYSELIFITLRVISRHHE